MCYGGLKGKLPPLPSSSSSRITFLFFLSSRLSPARAPSLRHASLIKGKGVTRLLKLGRKALRAGKEGSGGRRKRGKMMKRGGRGVERCGG